MAAGSPSAMPSAQSVNPGDTASRAAVAAAAAAAASAKPLIKLLLKVNPDGAQERVMVGMQYPLGHLPLFLALQVRSVAVFSLSLVRVFVFVRVCVCWSVRRRRSLFVRVCVCVRVFLVSFPVGLPRRSRGRRLAVLNLRELLL